MKNILKIALIIVGVSLSLANCLVADAPGERFHVTLDDSIQAMLRQTNGILTINSRQAESGNHQMNLYIRDSNGFSFDKTVSPTHNTVPISNYGYYTTKTFNQVSNYRYPIYEVKDDYVHISYNCKEGLDAWVKLSELDSNFNVGIWNLDSIVLSHGYFIDIYCFTRSGERKVYAEPEDNSEFTVYSRQGRSHAVFALMDQKNGYLKIGRADFRRNIEHPDIEPVGWIKMKDSTGMLMFWIKMVDLC